jgi:hypothetical protein
MGRESCVSVERDNSSNLKSGRRNRMGRARELVAEARAREPRPEPDAAAQQHGARRAQGDGSITVVRDWNRPEQPATASVVDRAAERVFD